MLTNGETVHKLLKHHLCRHRFWVCTIVKQDTDWKDQIFPLACPGCKVQGGIGDFYYDSDSLGWQDSRG